jgi:hypothetical protein
MALGEDLDGGCSGGVGTRVVWTSTAGVRVVWTLTAVETHAEEEQSVRRERGGG